MASEDSDQLVPGLAPGHRLRDLSDLDEPVDRQMTAGGDLSRSSRRRTA